MSVEDARGRTCVLVVDDDEDVRETLRDLVEMGGCCAALASNGAVALAMMRQSLPCMVILDLRMPVMSGGELLAIIRQDEQLADVPVVVSTSAPNRAPPDVMVFPKPVEIDALWEWMRQHCRCKADR